MHTVFTGLPTSLHPQALCAHFPSITFSNSLNLHGSALSPTSSIHALAAAAQLSSLTSLCLTDIDTGDAEASVGDVGMSQLALAGERSSEHVDLVSPSLVLSTSSTKCTVLSLLLAFAALGH
jgi:hypothetical protein